MVNETILILSNISHVSGNTSSGTSLLTHTVTWFTAFSALATVLLNGLILLIFILHRSIRTHFNVYIANLAIAELLLGIIDFIY